MSFANTITKLRILAQKAKRAEVVADKIKETEINAAWNKHYSVRRMREEADQLLFDTLEFNGYCGWCEKPHVECNGHNLLAF